MVTSISMQIVTASDLLTLAALPLPKPTMILDMKTIAEIDHQVIREVVAASIPTGRRISRHTAPAELPAPRPSRLHIALEGAL